MSPVLEMRHKEAIVGLWLICEPEELGFSLTNINRASLPLAQ